MMTFYRLAKATQIVHRWANSVECRDNLLFIAFPHIDIHEFSCMEASHDYTGTTPPVALGIGPQGMIP